MGFFDGMNDIFGVGNTISQSANTQPDDVLKTKTALAQTGHYQVPDFGITDIPDMGMIDGLKGFQQDNGLKVDGVMKPGGPTETKLGETLANQGTGNMDLLEQAKPKKPKIDPLTGVEEIKMPKLKKPKKTAWFQSPKVQPVEDETHSANTRTMDGLLKYSVNGSLPYLYADSIKNGGDKAINEYANFMQQLNDRKSDRVETFHQEVMERLPEPHKQKFTALEMVDDRNETPLDQGDWNEYAQRFQATNNQAPEDTEASPSLYRTASAETSFSQPTTAAMMVESDGDDKNTQDRSYDEMNQQNDGEPYRFKAGEGIDGQKLPPAFVSPTDSGEVRKRDRHGEGRYGASRGGGKRLHEGVDYVAKLGEKIKSTVSGEVISVKGKPYTQKEGEPDYRIVDVKTGDGYIVRHYYVQPGVKVGDRVVAGKTELGEVQDLGKRYPGMTNHTHVEIREPEIINNPKRRGKWGKRKAINPKKAIMRKD